MRVGEGPGGEGVLCHCRAAEYQAGCDRGERGQGEVGGRAGREEGGGSLDSACKVTDSA